MVWARHQVSVVVRTLRMAGFAVVGVLVGVSFFSVAALVVGTQIAKHTREQREAQPNIDTARLPSAVAQNEELLEALRMPETERFNTLWNSVIEVNDDSCREGHPVATIRWHDLKREDFPVLLLRDSQTILREITTTEGQFADTDLQIFVPYSYKLAKRTKGWFFLRDGKFHFYGVVSERQTGSVSVLPGACNVALYSRVRPYVVNVTRTNDPSTFTFAVAIRDSKLRPKAYRWTFSDSLYIPARPTPWSQSSSIVKRFVPTGQREMRVTGVPDILLEDGSVKTLGTADIVMRQ